ncbi:MAG: 3-deoxy-8-phosphooctulonate synthase [Nitrospiraceae bacterium]|nr:MAG: 3-deoxy-8-phosphooctulonate synthase [Nitrospiraceae bacterium]
MTSKVIIGNTVLGGGNPLCLIAGPCVIEDEDTVFYTAQRLKEMCSELNIPFIFKSSYDKANRTSLGSFRGPGIDRGLRILSEVKSRFQLPILSDVHSVDEVKPASEVLDVLQIPAFLCRQTDLILAASRTGKTVNIKKGQFLAPWDMKNIIDKCTSTGNRNVFVTERGTSFGYNNLVVDIRSFPILRSFGFPVVFDVTHSLQLPGGKGICSGGQREFAEPLARSAVAAGVDGLFMEVHPEPDKALCDGPNMLSLDQLPQLLKVTKNIHELISSQTPDTKG